MKKRAARPSKRSTKSKARPGPARAKGRATLKGPAKVAKPRAKARKPARASAKPPAKAKGSGERGKGRASTAKRPRPTARSRPRSAAGVPGIEDAGHITELPETMALHRGTSPALSGGDVDADWMGSEGAGEETVGGSVATPDQDVVDEIGRALGVEQAPDEQVRSSEEILRERTQHRWDLEREAAEEDEGRER